MTMTLMRNKLVVILIVSTLLQSVGAGSFFDIQKLQRDLHKKMDTGIRPMLNQSNVLQVHLLPSLVQVQGLMEKEQLFFSTFVLQFSWIMDTLAWNPALYGGIDTVHLSPRDTWFPDIVYTNTINNLFEIKNGERMRITVHANGSSTWMTGGNLVSYCRVDITHYPFDEQVCKVVIGKMYSYDYELMIIPSNDKLDLRKYEENDEWILTGNDVRYSKIKDQLHFVELVVSLKRRPFFYLMNVIFPITLLSLMNIFTFKLPISSGERITYCLSMLITYCVFLSTVSGSIPRVSQTVSYLQLYASIQLAVGMLTTTISIYLLHLGLQENKEDVPRWIRMLYQCTCNKRATRNLRPDPLKIQVEPMTSGDCGIIQNDHLNVPPQNTSIDTNRAVRFIDNICFWIFFLLYILSTLILFLKMTLK